ncbi:alpha-copaene synthase-like [Mercurialis annua]|uniref:alpha-copaene synthase-like n=1 Tax=Mercurialis annua TaxID=3986 RepID=UPI00215DE552|nr:alpha-copaene synthase-like [Mercurialis annua]
MGSEEPQMYNQIIFVKLDKSLQEILWWKSLDVATKLPYARDRVVECYFWMMGIYFESQYSFARIIMAKLLAILSLLDDTYDNHATFEEAEILTEAIQRWDIKAIDALPEYMKIIYSTLLDLYNEYEENIANGQNSLYSLHYAKEATKRVARAYLAEAKWREEDYTPTMEEYMEVSLISTCYPLLAIISFLGLGEIATEDAYEWASKDQGRP